MSDDYAVMIKNELGGVADIIGVSTGGAIAQHFAIDHPDLVGRLVLVMTGFRLTEEAKELQMKVATSHERAIGAQHPHCWVQRSSGGELRNTFSNGLCGC